MKTLILYYSKHGVTKKVARLIHSQVKGSTLSLISDFKGDLNDFEDIYLGSPTYMGKLNKDFLQFVQKNKETLLTKNVKVFVVGMEPDKFDTLLINNFDEESRTNFSIKHVGGGYNFNSMNFIERFIVKKYAKVTSSEEHLNDQAIKELSN